MAKPKEGNHGIWIVAIAKPNIEDVQGFDEISVTEEMKVHEMRWNETNPGGEITPKASIDVEDRSTSDDWFKYDDMTEALEKELAEWFE
jgi:hypothetical protein